MPRTAYEDPNTDAELSAILKPGAVIAVVGASANADRPSYAVMAFLIEKGFVVHPINPGVAGGEILGRKVYGSLAEVPAPVDIVDIFRNSEAAAAVVDEALAERQRVSLRTIWMQLGVVNEAAARKAEAEGLSVVMNRCPKIEVKRLRRD